MGQFSDCLQDMQLFEGRQDSRRGWNEAEKGLSPYGTFLEKNIISHLLSKYNNRNEEVVIKNDIFTYIEVEDLDVDLDFLRIAFKGFNEIRVGTTGFHVSYS